MPIVLAKKHIPMLVLLIFALSFTLAFLYADYKTIGALCERGTHVATLGNLHFKLHTLTTPDERTKGLSGKEFLRDDEGALFVFGTPTEIGFWMKDMLFPIDIIFLDEEYRVIGLFADVHPDSYPRTFISPPTMRYTLEVKSGTIEREKIALGGVVDITQCKN